MTRVRFTNSGGSSASQGLSGSTVGVTSKSTGAMTEAGVGALLPWADRLWFTVYPAENAESDDLGLFSIGLDERRPRLDAETNACDTGRILHRATAKAIVGRHIISSAGVVTAITGFNAADRVTAYCMHPLAPTTKVLALTMSSNATAQPARIYEVTMATGAAVSVTDATTGLGLGNAEHFKSMWSAGTGADARVYVANNKPAATSLAAINPNTWAWTAVSGTTADSSWIEVGGAYMEEDGAHVFATGLDLKSALLRVFSPDPAIASVLFRLPIATWNHRHRFQQEWMRIRQVSTERLVMDLHGTFYDLSPFLHDGTTLASGGVPRLLPLSRHFGTFPDYTPWDGGLVLAQNLSSPHKDQFPNAGQPQGGLLFTDQEFLHRGMKPTGRGHWWKQETVVSGVESPKMLMRGYDRCTVHLSNGTSSPVDVTIKVYEGKNGNTYSTVTVPANGYQHVEFPDAYSADWVTVTAASSPATFSAWLTCA